MNDREWLAGCKPQIRTEHAPGRQCCHPLCEIASVRKQMEDSLPREVRTWESPQARALAAQPTEEA